MVTREGEEGTSTFSMLKCYSNQKASHDRLVAPVPQSCCSFSPFTRAGEFILESTESLLHTGHLQLVIANWLHQCYLDISYSSKGILQTSNHHLVQTFDLYVLYIIYIILLLLYYTLYIQTYYCILCRSPCRDLTLVFKVTTYGDKTFVLFIVNIHRADDFYPLSPVQMKF